MTATIFLDVIFFVHVFFSFAQIWPGLRDTSSDFPSSTLSSKDSGVSTLSNKKSKNSFLDNSSDLGPELRERPSGEVKAPRPITIASSNLTSAPNLLVIKGSKVTGKPRMPEPEHEELHVNRIHVSSPSVTNSVYMNVPKHPEYVNYAADSKHQYVNVPETSQPSTPKRKPFSEFYSIFSSKHMGLERKCSFENCSKKYKVFFNPFSRQKS